MYYTSPWASVIGNVIEFHDNLVRDFVDNTDIFVVFSLCMKLDGSDCFICINMARAVLKSFYISLLHVL